MSDPSTMTNCITWTEIPVVDLARAQKFYSTVFGWSFPTFGPPSTEPPKMAFFTHGPTHGSFVTVDSTELLSPALHSNSAEKKPFAVRVTVSVESVDKKLVEVEENGGKLYLPKKLIPGNMGAVIYFTDTEGNVMGLWSKE